MHGEPIATKFTGSKQAAADRDTGGTTSCHEGRQAPQTSKGVGRHGKVTAKTTM